MLLPSLIPSGDTPPPLDAFPRLATQVSASLLGFYLASVGIVLGTAYHEVSSDVRALIFGNARTKLYLQSIGIAIGAGLILILLKSLNFSFGYFTLGVYVLLIAFSGWVFIQLAIRAFNLFNPIVLAEEPLRVLFRITRRIGSSGLLGDEAVLRATALQADRSLAILAELIDLTSKRVSVDRNSLAGMVANLLFQVRLYSARKRLLAPTSAWFLRRPVYPKWIETDHAQVSIALRNSTPLSPQMEPETDWLERRAAEIAAAALEACVVVGSQDAALRITREVASTTQVLAQNCHFDDAIVFAETVRDRCWANEAETVTTAAVATEPPFILASLLLGMREAIASWPEDIRRAVAVTAWDRRNTKVVPIRGSLRMWTAAQRLLREIQAEQDIEGRRVTPDWYLQFALAGECILSLRELAQQLPDLLNAFAGPVGARPAPGVKAATGAQTLQAIAKAEFVAETIPYVIEELEGLRRGHDLQEVEELKGLLERLRSRRSSTLEGIAVAVTELKPEPSKAAPDLFGEALFTLVHHTEDAIASGDVDLMQRVFPSIVFATFILDEYVRSTYGPPTYQINLAVLDPIVDILELSGLALVYEVLRDDKSGAAVRQVWVTCVGSLEDPEHAAQRILDMLDLAVGSWGMSPRSIARTEWEMRLTRSIVAAGFARPEYHPFNEQPTWTAPPLIKMVGVSESMPSIFLHPSEVFAAEVLGPLSGESDETLRKRPGLRRYYETLDLLGEQVSLENADDNKGEISGDGVQ